MIDFREAKTEDDSKLTELVARPLPGDLSLSFGREPSLLESCTRCGPKRRILVGHTSTEPIAVCTHFPWSYYANDGATEIEIVADFRAVSDSAHRGITGLGWRALRGRLEGRPAVISVVNDNPRSLRLFTKKRRGWPTLHKVAQLQTWIYPLVKPPSAPLTAVPGPEAVIRFWNEWAKTHFLAPQLQMHHLGREAPHAHQFVALSSGTGLTACGALWMPDQYRTIRVFRYDGWYATLRRLRLLPPPGSEVPVAFAAFVAAHSPGDRSLILRALAKKAWNRGARFLIWGGDQRLPSPFPHPRLSYPSTLFQLLWDEERPLPSSSALCGCQVAWL